MSYSKVSVYQVSKIEYPKSDSYFRPSEIYPEYQFDETSTITNYVYEAVRENFHLMGFDYIHFGKKEWNPLGEYIKPGNTVLIKPNLVIDKNAYEGTTECLYTQPSVVAAVIDYVLIALHGKGRIVIGDAPMQECDFENLMNTSGYKVLLEYYQRKGIDISLVDFRELTSKVVSGMHVSTINEKSIGKVIDLGKESEFCGIDEEKLGNMRITNYNPKILPLHHNSAKHEYYVSSYMLDADVIINMPKPKSHRKAGATIALKNFVGVNIRKEYLPHHTRGAKSDGGDEYDEKKIIHVLRSDLYDKKNYYESTQKYKRAKVLQFFIRACSIILKLQRNKYSEGSWYGNRTISKTVSDINKIVYYADRNGKMCETIQRKILIVADMIKAGEGEGPVLPSSKDCGIIAVGTNPICFDESVSVLMGFDYNKIPTIEDARNMKGKYKIDCDNIEPWIISNVFEFNGRKPKEIETNKLFKFMPSYGWRSHIEV